MIYLFPAIYPFLFLSGIWTGQEIAPVKGTATTNMEMAAPETTAESAGSPIDHNSLLLLEASRVKAGEIDYARLGC